MSVPRRSPLLRLGAWLLIAIAVVVQEPRSTPSALTVSGRDATASGFDFGVAATKIGDAEITVSRNGGTITGRAADGSTAVDSYAVVVFPVDSARLAAHSPRLRLTRSWADGTFRVTGLPPGDYYVAAVDRMEGTLTAGEWQSAAVLAQLISGAERVTLGERDTPTVTLRRIRR